MVQFIINIVLFFNKNKIRSAENLKVMYIHKILNCINSCESVEQVNSCDNIIESFWDKFKCLNSYKRLVNYSFDKSIELM